MILNIVLEGNTNLKPELTQTNHIPYPYTVALCSCVQILLLDSKKSTQRVYHLSPTFHIWHLE